MPLKYTTHLGILERRKNDLALAVRQKIFEVFMRECAPGPCSNVADFGVSGHHDHPVHYFFESLYPHTDKLTAIGRESEDAGWMTERFAGITFLEADLRSIPLPDGYFDAGICNAVVEHAGTRAEQQALVREVCRVCKSVLFTTPNRRFPLELHTFLPFVHWLPEPAFRASLRLLRFRYFADPANLNPLDAASLLALFPSERDTHMVKIGSGLLSMNLLCVSTARPDQPALRNTTSSHARSE
jgi:hypothetical protein